MTKWNKRFFEKAMEFSGWSKDPSTKVGAVIVGPEKNIVSVGYNGFARKVKDTPDRLNNRDIKYKLTVHAESNAIFNAHRAKSDVFGCKLYVWPLPPCCGCANAAIQVGISEVHCFPFEQGSELESRWKNDIDLAERILSEAGVKLFYHDRSILEELSKKWNQSNSTEAILHP